MKKSFSFTIGNKGREVVKLDAMTLVDSRLLACANSGGGKSFLLRGLVEQVGGKIPTIILDPEGEFSTLREKLDMVLVGDEGDIDPDPKSAALLCRKLIELRLSAVIDLYELKMDQRRRFVKTFLEALIDLPRKLWGPTFIVIDEAHKFCPERGGGQAESTDAVISLMSQGRKRGFGGCLVTQRLSKLHKDATGECNNVLLGRCTQDVDLKRAGDILGLSSVAERNKLRGLKPGHFYGFGPAFSHDGPKLFKTRTVETTHPDSRTRHKIQAPAASKAIQKVLPELADLPAKAEEEKATLEAAQAETRRLARELKKLQRAQPKPEVDEDTMRSAVDRAVSLRDKVWKSRVSKLLKGIQTEAFKADRAAKAMEGVGEALRQLEDPSENLPGPKYPTGIKVTRVSPPKGSNGVLRSRGEEMVKTLWESRDRSAMVSKIKPSGVKILNALAQFPDGLDTKRMGIITGLATRGGSYNTVMSTLRQEELIEGSKVIKITDRGIGVVGEPEPLPTGSELVDLWKDRLKNVSSVKIFDAFIARKTLSVDEIGEKTGLATRGGSFNTAMARIRAMDLIRKDGRSWTLNPDLAKAIRE